MLMAFSQEQVMKTRPAKLLVVVKKWGSPGLVEHRKASARYWGKPTRRVAFRVAQAPD
jgi:hypothetical protein